MEFQIIRQLRRALDEKDRIINDNAALIRDLKNELVEFRPRRLYFDIRDTRYQDGIKDKLKLQIIKNNGRIEGYGILQKHAEYCLISDDPAENRDITVNISNCFNPNPFGDIVISVAEALFIKDKLFISDEKYKEIRLHFNQKLPSLKKIKALRSQLNQGFELTTINSENIKFVDINAQIKRRFYEHLSQLNPNELREIDDLRIKFTADGTNVGKNLSLVNFCFTFLNNNKHKSVFGNYTLGVGEIKEAYGCLKDPLNFIMSSVKEFDKYYFNGIVYKVDYFFGADMKFLLEVNGLKAANSNFPCLWCLANVNDLHLLGYSMVDPQKARDKSRCEFHINKRIDYGFKGISLLDIPLIKCIIDTLHLRIRVGLKLIELFLLNDLIVLDNYGGEDIINESHKNLSIWYYDFLRKKCKIGVKLIKFNNQNKAKITRDFNGCEIIKIFRSMNFNNYFENIIPNYRRKQELWRLFYWIDRGISWNKLSPQEIKSKTEHFNKLYFENYSNDEATPYIHAFCNHLHEFATLYGDISAFSEQGY